MYRMRENTEAEPITASPVISPTFITPLVLPTLGQSLGNPFGYVSDGNARSPSYQHIVYQRRRQGRIRRHECFITSRSCAFRENLHEALGFHQLRSYSLSATSQNPRRSSRLLAIGHPTTTIDIIPSVIDSPRPSTTNGKPRKRTNASTVIATPPISANPSSRLSKSSSQDARRHLDTLTPAPASIYTLTEQPSEVSSRTPEEIAANLSLSSEIQLPITPSSLLIQASIPNLTDQIPDGQLVKARAKPGRKPGSKLSEEHRQKIKMAMNQHFSSDNPAGIETRRLQSQAKLGEKNPMYNKKHASETLSLMSRKHVGPGNPNFGRTLSEATRSKISESMKQRWKMRREQEEKLNEEIRKKNELEENRRKYNQYRSVLKYRQSIM